MRWMSRAVAAFAATLILLGSWGPPAAAVTIQPSLYPALSDGSPSDPMNTGDAVCVGMTWTSDPLGLMGYGTDFAGLADIDFAPGETVTATVVGAWMDPDVGTVSVVEDQPTATFTMPDPWPPDTWNSIYGQVLTPAFFHLRLAATRVSQDVDFGAEIRFAGDGGSTATIRVVGIGAGLTVETPATAIENGHPEICAGVATVPPTSTLAPAVPGGAGPPPGILLVGIVGCLAVAALAAVTAQRRHPDRRP